MLSYQEENDARINAHLTFVQCQESRHRQEEESSTRSVSKATESVGSGSSVSVPFTVFLGPRYGLLRRKERLS